MGLMWQYTCKYLSCHYLEKVGAIEEKAQRGFNT